MAAPLQHNVPIVNEDGTPTPFFMRQWADLLMDRALLPVERMSEAARDELRNPREWRLIFNSTTEEFNIRVGGAWRVLSMEDE